MARDVFKKTLSSRIGFGGILIGFSGFAYGLNYMATLIFIR